MPPTAMRRLSASERTALLAQGGYYVATGLLPFVSRRAFEFVTGPKREWWLVQTVGALVTVIGVALLAGGQRRESSPELLGIAAGSAAALAGIDIVYVAKGEIAPTYLLDAAAELAFLGGLALGPPDRKFPRRAAFTPTA
jgi:hypothetical protein